MLFKAAFLGGKTSIRESVQKPFNGTLLRREIQPGGTADKVDVNPLNPRLLKQRSFHGTHTTAAFHPLNVEHNGLEC